MSQKLRYRISITDQFANVTRVYEAPVLLEMKNSRKFLGEETVDDLRIDARYVKQICMTKKRKVAHEHHQSAPASAQ